MKRILRSLQETVSPGERAFTRFSSFSEKVHDFEPKAIQRNASPKFSMNQSVSPLLQEGQMFETFGVFGTCGKIETCDWFNAFARRIFYDYMHSKTFLKKWRGKMERVLNKNDKPQYIGYIHIIIPEVNG